MTIEYVGFSKGEVLDEIRDVIAQCNGCKIEAIFYNGDRSIIIKLKTRGIVAKTMIPLAYTSMENVIIRN